MKATWQGTTIAESDETVVVEGNHYFPAASIRREFFQKSDRHTHCPWKGEASYYDIAVDGVALFVVGELFKRRPFFVGDNPGYVLIQPDLVATAQFVAQGLGILLLVFLTQRALQGIGLGVGRRLRIRIPLVACFVLFLRWSTGAKPK